MICQRCLQRLARRSTPSTSASNSLSTSARRTFAQSSSKLDTPVTASTTTTTNPRPNDRGPAVLSTSAAQPFSAPLTPAPTPPKSSKTAISRAPSSVVAGTVLKGLNFYKNKQDPVALEDHEYPDWLWGVLEAKDGEDGGRGGDVEGDLFSKSKKQRRRAAKALRKRALLNPESMVPKIPLYEQSVDLPGGDGSLAGAKRAGEARGELTKAMRDKRRSKIKEDNFLKAMG